MKRVPHSQGVSQALRSVRAATKKSLKGLNQVAAQRMARGDYPTAETLAGKGKELRQFQLEVEALRKRWREVCGVGDHASKKAMTPLWAYYQPILKALVEAGGTARRTDIEPTVLRLMSATFLPGDHEPLGRGTGRWQVMIRRARRHLVAEGWIESGSAEAWRITEAGRRSAEKEISPPKLAGV